MAPEKSKYGSNWIKVNTKDGLNETLDEDVSWQHMRSVVGANARTSILQFCR